MTSSSWAGSSMPGKILITALSSSLAIAGGGGLHEHLVRGGRQRQRKFAGARGVEHQAQVLDEDVDRRQRRVVARQHMGHAVLEHPAVAGAVGDDLVQRLGRHAFAQAQRHRLGGGGDVHAGQQLVDDLHLAAGAGAVAQPVDLAGHRVEQRAGLGIGLGPGRGHHRHLAAGGLGGAAGDRRVDVEDALRAPGALRARSTSSGRPSSTSRTRCRASSPRPRRPRRTAPLRSAAR